MKMDSQTKHCIAFVHGMWYACAYYERGDFLMAKTANMYIRIDPDVKSDVENIYAQYGMSITDAINVFLYTSRNIGGLPFDLRPSIPNAETLEAMEEVKRMKKDPSLGKAYTDVDQMMKELLA